MTDALTEVRQRAAAVGMKDHDVQDFIDSMPATVKSLFMRHVRHSMDDNKLKTCSEVLDWISNDTEAFDELNRLRAGELRRTLQTYIRGREG